MASSPPKTVVDNTLFRDVFDASPIGIVVENLDGQPLFINPAFCAMLGFTEKEVRNKHCVDFSPPEDSQKDWALFQQLKAGSIDHYQLEKRYFRKDGSLLWGRLNLSLLNSRPSPLVIAMVEDITDKKTAEGALQRSEEHLASANERLQLAIESGSVGGWDFDLKTGKNFWFGKAHAQLGVTPAQTLGSQQEFRDRVHEDDRERVVKALQVAKEKRADFAEDFRVIWRDGTTHWLRSRGRYHYGANGQPERMLGISLEITEQKLAEEALLRHAAIVESSDDAIASVSVHGITLSWNAGAQQMFGYSKEETVGKPASMIVPPELRDQQRQIFEKLLAGGRVEQLETVRVSKTGKRIDVSLSISPIKDSTGKIVACAGTARDITKRKRAEEALLSSERRYRLLFERNVAGVGIATVDGRLLDCNEGWARILGYQSRDELRGRHASEFYFNPTERQPVVNELFTRKVLFSRELHLKRKDGTPVWVLFNAAVHSDHDRPLVQATMIDISEWKRAEEALSGMTRKLIEAQEQERVRIGRELHDDINQRLAMVSVKMEQLQQSPAEFHSFVQELKKELQQIANDVQDISHDLHSTKLEYLGVIAGMRSWCREVAERHKIEVAFKNEFAGNLRLDLGVPLFRVLQEAIHNAIKHSGEKRVEVQLREDSGEIHLVVSDSGKGFDLDTELAGKGLGLTSMKERVRLVNGTIAIKSAPTVGTSVEVRIPLVQRNNTEQLSS